MLAQCQGSHYTVVNMDDIAPTMLTVQVVLDYSTCVFIMACNTFPSIATNGLNAIFLELRLTALTKSGEMTV